MVATMGNQKLQGIRFDMGQTAVIDSPEVARTVLGSCIGLVLFDTIRHAAAVAHIVLPSSTDREGGPGRFADTAVPHLLELLTRSGSQRRNIVAKLAGGSSMLGGQGPLQIGVSNIEAVTQLLQEKGIPVVAKHVGGDKGRRVAFFAESGKYAIEIVGQPRVVI